MATSDLLSNAQQVTSVDGNSIIPVASAAGQPTRNVKLSTLASVVGGLIGTATITKDGLMSSSVYKGLQTIRYGNNPPTSINIGALEGLIVYSREYAGSEYGLYLVSSRHKSIDFISGFDRSKDMSFNDDGDIIFSGSGIYWGGLNIIKLGGIIS